MLFGQGKADELLKDLLPGPPLCIVATAVSSAVVAVNIVEGCRGTRSRPIVRLTEKPMDGRLLRLLPVQGRVHYYE